jgi:small-conductance mechanosensitive channel
VTKLLKPLTGHTYVARLLAQPQQEFHVAALLASVADDERVLADNTAAEVVDHQAVQAYRREIEDLQEELGLAQKYHDLGRQEALEQQLDALVCELARVTGLGGKRRQVGRADQIRKSVCNAIERSLTYIEERHAALASHLRATLELGYKPVYRPAQSVEWQT